MKEAYLKYLLDQKSAFVDVPIPKPSPTQLLIKVIVSGSNLKKVICVHNDGLMLDPDLYSCCPPRPQDKGAKTKVKTVPPLLEGMEYCMLLVWSCPLLYCLLAPCS